MAMRREHHFLLDEVQMYGIKKDAEKMKDALMKTQKYLQEIECEINGFNRDNESKMRKCGDLFLAESNINDIGCGPHILHVILKNFFAKNGKCHRAKKKAGLVLTHLKKSKSKHHLEKVAG